MGKRYLDIDETYLKKAIDRIKDGLEIISRIPVMISPTDAELDKATNSVWAVDAALLTIEENSSDSNIQTWSVGSWLAYKPRQEKYDATIYSAMQVLAPKIFNYMQAHKRLVFKDGQDKLPYLLDDRVQVALNDLNQGGQPGFTIFHRLPFGLVFQQE
jgi:hypothetical protein